MEPFRYLCFILTFGWSGEGLDPLSSFFFFCSLCHHWGYSTPLFILVTAVTKGKKMGASPTIYSYIQKKGKERSSNWYTCSGDNRLNLDLHYALTNAFLGP